MIRLFFYKNALEHLTLCYYEGGMISLFDEKGKSIKITQSELYDLFKSHFDKCVNNDSICG